jgi:hypothetical protein
MFFWLGIPGILLQLLLNATGSQKLKLAAQTGSSHISACMDKTAAKFRRVYCCEQESANSSYRLTVHNLFIIII